MFGDAVWKGCGSFVLFSLTRRGKAGPGQNLKILSILLPAQGFCLLVHTDTWHHYLKSHHYLWRCPAAVPSQRNEWCPLTVNPNKSSLPYVSSVRYLVPATRKATNTNVGVGCGQVEGQRHFFKEQLQSTVTRYQIPDRKVRQWTSLQGPLPENLLVCGA